MGRLSRGVPVMSTARVAALTTCGVECVDAVMCVCPLPHSQRNPLNKQAANQASAAQRSIELDRTGQKSTAKQQYSTAQHQHSTAQHSTRSTAHTRLGHKLRALARPRLEVVALVTDHGPVARGGRPQLLDDVVTDDRDAAARRRRQRT